MFVAKIQYPFIRTVVLKNSLFHPSKAFWVTARDVAVPGVSYEMLCDEDFSSVQSVSPLSQQAQLERCIKITLSFWLY